MKVGEFKGEDVCIRTIIIDQNDQDKQKPVLVLVHGYTACSGLYYTLFKRLSKYFRFVVIDQIGSGLSSRPSNCDFKKMTAMDYINYFVNYFE